MMPASFRGTRTSGTVSVEEMPWSIRIMSASSMSPCCISTHTQSNPQFAKISADMALGTVNHPRVRLRPAARSPAMRSRGCLASSAPRDGVRVVPSTLSPSVRSDVRAPPAPVKAGH